MSRRNLPRFEDWEAQKKLQDPQFRAAAEDVEPGYQVARLPMLRGLSQAQLTQKVGTRQPSIARLENGSAASLFFLNRIVVTLDAKVEVRLVPREPERKG
jgi:ribosome-binding protein aMBF1 (putative translation factor)